MTEVGWATLYGVGYSATVLALLVWLAVRSWKGSKPNGTF